MGKKIVIETFEDEDFGNIDDLVLDKDCLEYGVDVEVGPGRYIQVTYAGPENRKYRVKLAEIAEEFDIDPTDPTLEDDEAAYLLQSVYADSVCLGWRGFTKKDGSEKPYSRKSLMSLFQKSPTIWQRVFNQANEFANFSIRGREQAGN